MSDPTRGDRDRTRAAPQRNLDDDDRRPVRDRDGDGVDDRGKVPARGHDRGAGDGRRGASRRAAGRGDMVDRDTVVERESKAYGGLKMGSAFFGWLSAMGLAVLLTALLTAVGVAVGLGTGTTVEEAADQVQQDPSAIGWAGVIGLLVILFVSYFAGGYVAGRMARFDGAKQGFGVWLWALIAAAVVAVLGLVAGEEFNVLVVVDGFPRIPIGEGELTTIGIVALILAAIVPLVAAILGGLAGMRFHRAVDDAGLGRARS